MEQFRFFKFVCHDYEKALCIKSGYHTLLETLCIATMVFSHLQNLWCLAAEYACDHNSSVLQYPWTYLDVFSLNPIPLQYHVL